MSVVVVIVGILVDITVPSIPIGKFHEEWNDLPQLDLFVSASEEEVSKTSHWEVWSNTQCDELAFTHFVA